jgi:hypothetical protein
MNQAYHSVYGLCEDYFQSSNAGLFVPPKLVVPSIPQFGSVLAGLNKQPKQNTA